ncbi:MAG: hypothetical protein FWG65_03880 [Turicibacter sp.]|nr:hypothetical protein [Turicibacter sp.]
MMDAAIFVFFCRHFEETGKFDELRRSWEEQRLRETAFEMLQRNFDIKDIAAILKMPTEWVQNLATTPTDAP